MTATIRPYRAQDLGCTLRLWVLAVAATRPTVTEEMVEIFRGDPERFTRQ